MSKTEGIDEIKAVFAELEQHAGKLTDSQLAFVRSLQKQHKAKKQLTERQQKTLFEIRKFMQA